MCNVLKVHLENYFNTTNVNLIYVCNCKSMVNNIRTTDSTGVILQNYME